MWLDEDGAALLLQRNDKYPPASLLAERAEMGSETNGETACQLVKTELEALTKPPRAAQKEGRLHDSLMCLGSRREGRDPKSTLTPGSRDHCLLL